TRFSRDWSSDVCSSDLFSTVRKTRSQTANRKPQILLNLFYLDFRVTLTVSLFAFVLFAAFLFENDDLFAAAVTENRRFDLRVAEIGRASCRESVSAPSG